MESLTLGQSDLESSRLIYGCMRIVGDNSREARDKGKQAIRTAIEEGYQHFDHADIYGGGECESLFAEVLDEMRDMRDRLLITSKCGIRGASEEAPARYDFSSEHITTSVEESLSRLRIERLDLLLLHRPDILGDPEKVVTTFESLHKAGKVAQFGVSNFQPSQVSALQAFCPFPLLVHQVEINIHNIQAMQNGTLDQCIERQITPSAWCPLGGVAYPAWGNTFSEDDERRIDTEFAYQADQYGTEPWIVALAWLLKHPAKIAPIVGSTTPARIRAAKEALAIDYTREDWYRLLEARNGYAVP